jgi:hypothetical protein
MQTSIENMEELLAKNLALMVESTSLMFQILECHVQEQ